MDGLKIDSLKKINCLCIVQHHSDVNSKIKDIYENSLVPYIYDCQSKLQINKKSKTLLEYLGD